MATGPATHMPPDEARALAREYRRTGDVAVRNRLAEAHHHLAETVAARYRWSGQPFEDLVQEALVGIIKAAQRFDPEREAAFATYARHLAHGELRHHLRDRGRLVRIPGYLQNTADRRRCGVPDDYDAPPDTLSLEAYLAESAGGRGEDRELALSTPDPAEQVIERLGRRQEAARIVRAAGLSPNQKRQLWRWAREDIPATERRVHASAHIARAKLRGARRRLGYAT